MIYRHAVPVRSPTPLDQPSFSIVDLLLPYALLRNLDEACYFSEGKRVDALRNIFLPPLKLMSQNYSFE
jgi:hypothetical protein